MIAEISENFRGGNTSPPGNTIEVNEEVADVAEIPISETPSKKRKLEGEKIHIAYHWVLTWNNYPKNWKDFFEDRRSLIEKLYIGVETCPTTGTPHLQGWLRLSKKNNVITYLTMPKQIHWAPMSRNATEKQNTMYCSKVHGEYLSWGIPLPWRRQIQDIKPWMTELINILSKPLEEGEEFRTIYWLWEPEGNIGKTVFQQAMYSMLEGVVAIEGKAADVKHFVSEYAKVNGKTPRIVFLNVPRCDQEFVSYGAIEKVKDMFFMSGKYEGGMVNGPRPHLMVFANDGPQRSKMSEDRWRVGRIVNDQIIWQ